MPSSTAYPDERGTWAVSTLLLVVATVLFLFARGLSDPDEGRYAEIPRGMVERGDASEMRLLGYRYYEKPPLFYWATAASLKMLGVRDWAARAPLFLVALALGGMGLYSGRKHWGGTRGLLAGAVMATTVCVFFGAKTLITDSFLLLWFSAACLALFDAFREPAKPVPAPLFAAALLTLLGVLTKGLLAMVLPCAIVFLWLAWEKRLRVLFRPATFAAAAVFLAVLLPVLALIERHNPGFVRYFFIEEHFARFLGKYDRSGGHPEPFWFYLPLLPLLLLPWTLFVFRAVRRMVSERALATDSFSRFLVVWSVVVVAFFSASTGKLISYVFPAVVPLALLIGRWGVAEPGESTGNDRVLLVLGLAGIYGMAAALPVLFILALAHQLPKAFAGLHPDGLAFLVVPVAAVLPFLARGRRYARPAGWALTLSAVYLSIALLFSPWSGYTALRNSAQLFKQLAAELRAGDQIVMAYTYRPALAFYLNRRPWIYEVRNEMAFGMDLEQDRPGLLADAEELASRVSATPDRWLMVLPIGDLPRLGTDLPMLQHRELARDALTAVVELAPDGEKGAD
jgi:4-amino-4-deoxy-L-arabinose transferase-like glycosyltransferase